MENYQSSMQPEPTEDRFTKTVEEYTASIPSSGYLGIAVAAMGASLLFQVTGQGKWGNFIAQWVPTWLIIGLYNKMVKLEGHDQTDPGNVQPLTEIKRKAEDLCFGKLGQLRYFFLAQAVRREPTTWEAWTSKSG
jgi:hypothetical protein